MDTREVSVWFTIHQGTVTRNIHNKEAERWQKKKASQHLAVCVLDYNKFIGGTHLPDQLLQYYSVHKRSNRWYRTLLP